MANHAPTLMARGRNSCSHAHHLSGCREKEPLDGVLRREQQEIELRGSAIVKTNWCALAASAAVLRCRTLLSRWQTQASSDLHGGNTAADSSVLQHRALSLNPQQLPCMLCSGLSTQPGRSQMSPLSFMGLTRQCEATWDRAFEGRCDCRRAQAGLLGGGEDAVGGTRSGAGAAGAGRAACRHRCR